jgi:hypothetical protein
MDTDRLLDPVVKAALKAMNDGDRATCTLGRLQDLLEIRNPGGKVVRLNVGQQEG